MRGLCRHLKVHTGAVQAQQEQQRQPGAHTIAIPRGIWTGCRPERHGVFCAEQEARPAG